MNDYHEKKDPLAYVDELCVEADNLRIQLRSARQIAEAFRENARVHRVKCEAIERENKNLKAMMKLTIDGCACCCHQGYPKRCQSCRRFTGLGEDLWEV